MREIVIHSCRKCNWKWVGRKAGKPNACPKCQSRSWDVERPKGNYQGHYQYQKTGKPGHPRRYVFDDLKPGETRTYPFDMLPDGSKDFEGMKKLSNALKAEIRKHGIVYYSTWTYSGLVVTRATK